VPDDWLEADGRGLAEVAGVERLASLGGGHRRGRVRERDQARGRRLKPSSTTIDNTPAEFRGTVYEELLGAIASHRVADRPDRYEPRRKKRRPKPYDRLMKPRHEAKRLMRNGFGKN